MKDEPVFWLGGKPGSPQVADAPPAAAALEPAVFQACRAQGLAPEDFVAAASHGSWLVHFTADARRQRLVWNGKDGKLVLQAALRSGGWEDLRDCAIATPDGNAFAGAIATLLGAGATG